MADQFEALRKALDLMAPSGAFHKRGIAVDISETEDWPNVRIEVRANKLVAPVVARYIKETEPKTIRALLSELYRLRAEDTQSLRDRIQELGRFAKDQRAEIDALRAEVERLRADAERYRALCSLNPREFHDLWMRALHGETSFDSIVKGDANVKD